MVKDASRFRKNIRQNQLLFVRLDTDIAKRAELLNIYDMNGELRNGYEKAMIYINAGRDVSNAITSADLLSILETPETLMDKHPVVRSMDERTELNCIRLFTSARAIACNWQVIGPNIADHNIHQTNGSSASGATVCTIGVRGDMEIEDIWGHDAGPDAILTLILKRTYECDGTWGPFAFHPYVQTGPFVPRDKLQYVDISGNLQFGIVYVIGRVRESSTKYTREFVRRMVVNAHKPDKTYAHAYNDLFSQVQRLTIHRHTPPGRPFNVILPQL